MTTVTLSYSEVQVPESGREVIDAAVAKAIRSGYPRDDPTHYAARSVWLEDEIRRLVMDMQAMAREIERLRGED